MDYIKFRKNSTSETVQQIGNDFKERLLTDELINGKEYIVYSIRKFKHKKYGLYFVADFGEKEYFLPRKVGSELFLHYNIIKTWKARFVYTGKKDNKILCIVYPKA